MTQRFSIKVNLPNTPDTKDPVLFDELLKIYNAIAALAIGVDDYTEGGELSLELSILSGVINSKTTEIARQILDLSTNLMLAQEALVLQLRREITELQEEINATQAPAIDWESPGQLGASVANTVDATVLTVTEGATISGNVLATDDVQITGRFAANGKPASSPIPVAIVATTPAETMSLANSCRSILISFGLATP